MGYTRGYQSVGVGDPFLHSFLLGLGRTALGAAKGALAGSLGVGGQPVTATAIQETVPTPTAFPGGFDPNVGQVNGARNGRKAQGGGFISAAERAAGPTGMKKRRRMNVLNVKALRRSTRRLAGFNREAKKVEKELRKLAPPARRRTPSHHHHVSSHN